MILRNRTPHPITLRAADGTEMTLHSEGVARVTASSDVVGQVEGLPIIRQTLGQVEGLPAKEAGVRLIVSRMVAAAADRDDLLVPAELVRDADGRVVAAAALEVVS